MMDVRLVGPKSDNWTIRPARWLISDLIPLMVIAGVGVLLFFGSSWMIRHSLTEESLRWELVAILLAALITFNWGVESYAKHRRENEPAENQDYLRLWGEFIWVVCLIAGAGIWLFLRYSQTIADPIRLMLLILALLSVDLELLLVRVLWRRKAAERIDVLMVTGLAIAGVELATQSTVGFQIYSDPLASGMEGAELNLSNKALGLAIAALFVRILWFYVFDHQLFWTRRGIREPLNPLMLENCNLGANSVQIYTRDRAEESRASADMGNASTVLREILHFCEEQRGESRDRLSEIKLDLEKDGDGNETGNWSLSILPMYLMCSDIKNVLLVGTLFFIFLSISATVLTMIPTAPFAALFADWLPEIRNHPELAVWRLVVPSFALPLIWKILRIWIWRDHHKMVVTRSENSTAMHAWRGWLRDHPRNFSNLEHEHFSRLIQKIRDMPSYRRKKNRPSLLAIEPLHA